MFGYNPKDCATPLLELDLPEIDTSDFIDDLGIKQYQSLIGDH
jgi:hypothetical protein